MTGTARGKEEEDGVKLGASGARIKSGTSVSFRVIFFPINAPGMDRFQLLNLGVWVMD